MALVEEFELEQEVVSMLRLKGGIVGIVTFALRSVTIDARGHALSRNAMLRDQSFAFDGGFVRRVDRSWICSHCALIGSMIPLCRSPRE